VTNDETLVVVKVDVITSVVDNSFSVNGVVTSGEISGVKDVVVVTSSGDVVIDCCITLVFAVETSSTSDVVLANCDVETAEEAIFPEVNAICEEARSSGDVLLVVILSSDVPATKGVVTSKEVVTFDGVFEVTLLVVTNVGRTVLCVVEDVGLCP